jgi:dihydroceramidase
MIVATSIVCHRAMTYNQSASFYRWFSGFLLLAVLAETAYHTITNEQVVHELSFVSLVIVVAIETRSLIRLRVQDLNDKRMLQRVVIFGAGMYSLTFSSRTLPVLSDRCRRMFCIRLPALAT